MEVTFDMVLDMLVGLDDDALECRAAPAIFRSAGGDEFTGLLMPVRS